MEALHVQVTLPLCSLYCQGCEINAKAQLAAAEDAVAGPEEAAAAAEKMVHTLQLQLQVLARNHYRFVIENDCRFVSEIDTAAAGMRDAKGCS
jgi:hypothetical protein